MNFSERNGYVVKSAPQIDYISESLRVSLWNEYEAFFDSIQGRAYQRNDINLELKNLMQVYWTDALKQPMNKIRNSLSSRNYKNEICNVIRQKFSLLEWNHVYDFLEI